LEEALRLPFNGFARFAFIPIFEAMILFTNCAHGDKALADMAQRRSGGVIYVRTGLSQEFLCHSAVMEINGLAGGQVSQRAPEHMYRCGREVEENQNGT